MKRGVIVDTGPLVALLNRRDHYHRWAADAMGRIEGPMISCEPVFTEAMWLLRREPRGVEALFEMLHRGVLELRFNVAGEAEALRRLMKRYRDLPGSLADISLVRLSELLPKSSVLTLDGDFRVYRRNGRQVIPLIIPPDR